MPLTLANFKQQIDETILQRGRSYYSGGRVLTLGEVEPGRWQAEVEGRQPYRVAITAGAGEALSWSCTCPYTGPVCKHIAAVLLALEAEEPTTPANKPPPRAERLRAALAPLSREELYELLLEQALSDRDLAHQILARYGLQDADHASYRQLVREALEMGKGRHGFLDYHGAAEAGRAIFRIFGRADDARAQGQPAQAVAVYQVVLEEVLPALEHADDSMGSLGDCAHSALEGLQEITTQLSAGARADLFAYCLAEAPKETYANWGFEWDLAAVAARLAATPAQRDALFTRLDEMAGVTEDRWGQFERQKAALLKLDVVRRQDDAPAVHAFLEAHSQHEQIQLELARFHLAQGRPAAARAVCEEWLAEADERRTRLHADFHALLLEIASAEGDPAEQVAQAEALFLATGRLEDYVRVKTLVDPEAWPDYRPGFLARVRQGRRYVNMGTLYREEEMWPELLAHVQANPLGVRTFHNALAGRFPRELAAVYEQLALATLVQKVNRKGYRQVCGYLRKMQALGQEARVDELIAAWREEYARRSALQDELDKAFGR